MSLGAKPAGPEPKAACERVIYHLQAPILESARLPGAHHRLVVRAPRIAALAQPGQFLHVWCHDPVVMGDPPAAAVLRRPFSISRIRSQEAVEILLRVRGTGGRILAARRTGETLDIIGPLGRGFKLDRDLSVAIIVAGGIGLAPVPFLIDTLVTRGVQVVLLAGAADDSEVPFLVDRSRSDRATLPEMEALGAEVTFVSEAVEGSLVSDVLEARLGESPGAGTEVFAVGPRGMLKRLAEITAGRLPLQVALEERMACGVGACRSCVIPARTDAGLTYRTVCREGPVFYASEIAWEHLET